MPTNPLVGEYTFAARMERDQLGNWQLVVSFPNGRKTQVESFSPDEPVVLLRFRVPEDLKKDDGEPCDGLMIWFEKPDASQSKMIGSGTSVRRRGAAKTPQNNRIGPIDGKPQPTAE